MKNHALHTCFLCLLIGVLGYASPLFADQPLLTRIYVAPPDSNEWLAQHAAETLANYVREMTGVGVRIDRKAPEMQPGEVVFTLSLGKAAEGLSDAGDEERQREGFVLEAQAPDRLLIAARKPIGLLYGVYHYLERYCHVGFFWDGDHVPKINTLPIEGVHSVEVPRWPVRHFGLPAGWGLSKWHHQLRTMPERNHIFDWMVKRKINRTHLGFFPTIATSGAPAARVFGLDDKTPDNFTFSGWPGCLDWSADTRTRINIEQLEYSRRLGISWVYYLAYGNVPHQFREMHPDYTYVGSLGYSATVLYPDDPECTRWTSAFYEDLFKTYGTDHIYQDTPFVESTGSDDPEKSFQLKLTAAKAMCEMFKKLDKDAIWQSDSWDFGAVPQVWTPERIQRYFASLPKEMMLVYDTDGINNPFYKKTNYFEGARWFLGILHSFQGDDHIHGNLNRAVQAFQELANDPKANKCLGIYHIPETTGHNLIYFDLTTRLAWNPEGVTVAAYLDEYARRRYGVESVERMQPALEALARGVHEYENSGMGGQMPIYKKLGCPYGPVEWWPIVNERKAEHPARQGKGIVQLHEAVERALACRRDLQDNPLYVNDLVEWSYTYIAHVFNWAVMGAYDAFSAGDAAAMQKNIDVARQCLRLIDAILSTRPDFSLQKQIMWAMNIPGANSYLPWYMKQHCINDLYSANEVFEQLHWYYTPRMDVYFSELETRAAQGIKTIEWKDIADRCAAIQKRWLEEDIAVPENEMFQGSTIEAVSEAFEKLDPVACDTLGIKKSEG
ncbi:MAG TPA: alpha-N-acetylglucosaminidase TIM-barrel domain-containing protein [Candidatus Hydrogenedentes bacterium]|nr:alpha-N-acetylglucosaminidase TIM-barrel domain-containing protein [Candidatus Hydrogenedentota bacterium]